MDLLFSVVCQENVTEFCNSGDSGSLLGTSGYIISPSFPCNYQTSLLCTLTLQSRAHYTSLGVNVIAFQTHVSDYLDIEVYINGIRYIRRYSGNGSRDTSSMRIGRQYVCK